MCVRVGVCVWSWVRNVRKREEGREIYIVGWRIISNVKRRVGEQKRLNIRTLHARCITAGLSITSIIW